MIVNTIRGPLTGAVEVNGTFQLLSHEIRTAIEMDFALVNHLGSKADVLAYIVHFCKRITMEWLPCLHVSL